VSELTLPHSIDAERAVLGTLLVNPGAVFTVGAFLKAEHFYRDAHRRIYAAQVALAETGTPCDFVTLKNELIRRGDLDAVGGPSYIVGLSEGTPSTTNVEHYAAIVREKANLRDLITTADKVIASAYAARDDAADVLDTAERELLRISEQAISSDLLFADAIVPETMALLEQIAQHRRPVTGLSTGLWSLDNFTRGLHPGNLLVLGGRPGEGKSALALQLALHVAKEHPVAFFSMEMSRDEIMTRALAQTAMVDHHAMMQGALSDGDQRKVGAARNHVEGLPIAFDDTAALTPFQIRSKAKKMQTRRGLGFVVVDYLQLLQRPRNAHSREEAVAENTWALKVLAGELKVPVLALSQLNRNAAKEGARPTLSDLRESGAVEQHANVVLLIYRPGAKSDGVVTEAPPVELIIGKQRNGPQGVHNDLVYNGPYMRFSEVERRYA
jgi:replicative DNA helicase